jgi:6-hydroxynicotinate 3-monooxygenase
VRVVREKFAGFHEQVRRVLAACPSVHKWALADRRPLPRWSDGPVVLLGDAAHPMTPYMAQGAAMALEDAAVLARCVAATPADLPHAFRRFQATRAARTAQMQDISHRNAWMDTETEADWVYGYDAWSVPLAED